MLSLKIPPHLKCVAKLPCDVLLKATIGNETSVTLHFKKLTTGNNVFIVSVIMYSNCRILQFLHQMFQSVRLAAGRRTVKMCCYRSRLVFNCCF